jgi:hypothetical protein
MGLMNNLSFTEQFPPDKIGAGRILDRKVTNVHGGDIVKEMRSKRRIEGIIGQADFNNYTGIGYLRPRNRNAEERIT